MPEKDLDVVRNDNNVCRRCCFRSCAAPRVEISGTLLPSLRLVIRAIDRSLLLLLRPVSRAGNRQASNHSSRAGTTCDWLMQLHDSHVTAGSC